MFEKPTEQALLGSDGVVDCAADKADPAKAGLNDIIACTTRANQASVVDVTLRSSAAAFSSRTSLRATFIRRMLDIV